MKTFGFIWLPWSCKSTKELSYL